METYVILIQYQGLPHSIRAYADRKEALSKYKELKTSLGKEFSVSFWEGGFANDPSLLTPTGF